VKVGRCSHYYVIWCNAHLMKFFFHNCSFKYNYSCNVKTICKW